MPHIENGGPLVKRQKRDAVSKARASPTSTSSSAIFAPFRTVGLVSPTGVPFTSVPLGKTTFQITTSVGRSLQTYDLKRGLNLVFLTRPQTPRDITATFAWKEKVFAAWGGSGNDDEDDEDDEEEEGEDSSRRASRGFWIFQRGRKVAEIALPADLDQPIRQILIFGSWIVACATTRIDVWKTATLEHYTTLQPTAAVTGGNELTGGICTMPTFLNKLFVGRRDGWVEIWNVSSGKLVYTILPPGGTPCGAVTCLEPTPALGLLAIAYAAGPLVIQDVARDQTLLAFDAGTARADGDDEDDDEGNNDAPVCSISFRTDGRGAGHDGRLEGVMATASTGNGDVTFWDLNRGGRVMGVLRSAHNPPARDGSAGGISRVEFLPGQPVIVTSGRDNALKSWIFDETPFSPVPRVLHQRSGHAAPVRCLAFLPSDFDGADAGNKWLLSGGRDRSLWGWSLRRDGQSTELSQGNIRQRAKKAGILSASMLRHGPTTTLDDLKAPEITCIASSLNRDGGMGALPGKQALWQKMDAGNSRINRNRHKKGGLGNDAEASGMTGWESVVTAHKDDAWARTWFWGRKRAGRWAFPTGDGAVVSTVAISPCGSFALVGSAGGSIDMYNLQSGQHRQHFPSRLTPAQARQLKMQQLRQADSVALLQSYGEDGSQAGQATAFRPGTGRHTKRVTGIVVDSMDKWVVSCSLDGTVKFWDFLTGHLIDQLDWAPMTAITGCRYHAANDLLAFSCDDGSVRVVDMATKKTIRELWATRRAQKLGLSAVTINDFCFSNDGRWVVAVTQEDARLRVWDLSTSHLIDSVVLDRPGQAVAFSATGEYLAVAPEDRLGVHIWTNKTLFKHVPTRPVREEDGAAAKTAKRAVAPTASGERGSGLIDAAFEDDDSQDDDGQEGDSSSELLPVSLDQLSADMTTLSLVPKSRWQTLLHLETIKQRNKPKEPPKAPEKMPFFVGTLASSSAEEQAAAAAGNKVGGATAATAALILADGGAEKKNDSDGATAGELSVRSRILALDKTRSQQAFSMQLQRSAAHGDFTPFLDLFKAMPPIQADLELRSLGVTPSAMGDGGIVDERALFVRALTSQLRARRDYELVQAWMTVFLRKHGSDVVHPDEGDDDEGGDNENSDLLAALRDWRVVQEQERRRLDALVGYCGGVLGFLRSPRS